MPRRGALAAIIAVALLASVPATVLGATWALTVLPLATTVGVSTTFSVTVTDMSHPNDLGCFDIQLPSSFVIQQVGTPSASSGLPWVATQAGSNVIVNSVSQAGRLKTGEAITFAIQATATQVGTWAWTSHSHRQQDCSGPEIPGDPVAIVVLPVPATPAPTPSAPAATPAPTPSAPAATPRPSATPPPPDASTPRPSGTPAPTESPPARSASGDPTPSPAPAAVVGRLAPPGDGIGNPIDVGTSTFTLLDGPLMWFVPGAAVGVPGLVVVAWIGLQAVGAAAWIPFVRRLGGDSSARRRRRRAASV